MAKRYKRDTSISYGRGKTAVKIVDIYDADTDEFLAYKVYDHNRVILTTKDYNEAERKMDWLMHKMWHSEDHMTEEQFKAKWRPRIARIA